MRQILAGLILLCCNSITAQDFTGNWQGNITIGPQQLRVVFHISKTGNVHTGTMDSPDQNVYGIPVANVAVMNDSINIIIKAGIAGYKGKRSGADEMSGILSQGPMRAELVLKRSALTIPSKPQTPKAPFDYQVEDVSFENLTQKIHLEGTFTKPKNGTKFPVVLMITGSGPQDRDETMGAHKTFLVIADHLTKLGIAVLRVDDRGIGKSTGNFVAATSADFATDVMAGIEYLKTRKDVDAGKIGLLGHSEGGLIAPYVAARSKDVAFIVMLAGPVEGGKKTMLYQAVTKPLANETAFTRKAYASFYEKMLQIGLVDSIATNHEDYIRRTYTKWKQQLPDSTVRILVRGNNDEEVVKALASPAQYGEFKKPWWRFFLSHDPADDVKRLQIPVLALNGTRDEQVSPSNLDLIKTLLAKSGNKDFSVVPVAGVNHMFQHCKDCGSVEEYMALDETFDKATLTLIGEWVVRHTK